MATITEHPKIRVGIAGVGISGCCLAIGLLRNPLLYVHLYESYASIKVRGSGLALHGNAINAMECIAPEIKAAYFRKSHFMAGEADLEMATQFILAGGQHDGTLVAELGRAKGRRTVHRAHFIQGLIESGAVPQGNVHFGKSLVGVKEDEATGKVTATFEDGKSETFDVFFGAEGVYSPTRKYIIGADHPAANPVNHDEWRCFNRHVPMEEAKKILSQESIEKVRCFCTPIGFINGIPVDMGTTFSVSAYQRDTKCPHKGTPPFDPTLWTGHNAEADAMVAVSETSFQLGGT